MTNTKYGDQIPDDYWDEEDDYDEPPRWIDETSCNIVIDVQLHQDGYQEDRKWTVRLSHRPDDDSFDTDLGAVYAVEHQNKGNFWREGDLYDDAVDFVDLPLRVRRHVAAVVNRPVDEITPDQRLVNRDDGTGVGDRKEVDDGE